MAQHNIVKKIYPKNSFDSLLNKKELSKKRGSNDIKMREKLIGEILERQKTAVLSLSELKKCAIHKYVESAL